eukprot:scaffold143_cov260-Pinguiococcus_pyrenoidosus.AAC.3
MPQATPSSGGGNQGPPGSLTVVDENLLDATVEHEGASVHGTEAGEGLGKTSEAPHGVEVGAPAVLLNRLCVQLQGGHGLQRRSLQVVVITVQSHGVADEGLRVGIEGEGLEELGHGHRREVLVFVGRRILQLVLMHEDDEGAEAALLEHAHERRGDGLRPRIEQVVNAKALR